jgi:hypothetical protein
MFLGGASIKCRFPDLYCGIAGPEVKLKKKLAREVMEKKNL